MRRATWHLVLGGAAALTLFPVAWAFLTSLRPANRIFEVGPTAVTLDNYTEALTAFPIGGLLWNTFLTAAAVTAGQLAVAVLAAYGLVRFRVRSARWIVLAVTVSLLVPPQALLVPQFLLAAELGWRDTLAGLVVPQLAQCGLAVLLLREHVRAVPASLLHAADLEGSRAGETLRFVVLPMLAPALGAVGILVFITTWNEFLWPALVAPSPEHTTIQAGLALFGNQEGPNFGPLLAAAVLACLPVLAAYLVASRRITDAFLGAGVR
ncbi:carbohydrate ABC transporter permease [Pseudonocardia abyssalis]|uniref:Carbohydrate ABC transporter permease n=1 Tax=Pseudonocardia abyssalis TaxID=2792008 RepID=A0ABS6UKR8_9PSEU|nr:carbohydrate ABC transporter permease [Pseudonocardia abyssalis]MBW0117109.1 carbohydrate ABC transporter permease [Pseudonocardia abyssalis]MBW0132859.1 carbohydrate ABC transporter permease [Pseudonocardia abyssalis]